MKMKAEIRAVKQKSRNASDGQKTTGSYNRHGGDSLSQPSEGISFADTLILDLQPPELEENTVLLLKPPSFCTLLQHQP